MRSYLDFLQIPGAKSLLAAAFPARLAYGMIGLGLYFKIYHATHSIAVAGLAAGINGVAGSLTTGIRASLLDRFGLKWPLRIFVPAYAASMIFVNLSSDKNLLLTAAGLLGVFAPPINLSVRPLWRTLVPSKDLRTAFALDSAALNIGNILGPAFVTILALSSHPGSALIVCALLLFVGGQWISFLPITKQWIPEVRAKSDLHLFKVPGIRVLMLEGIFIGFGSGIFNIALPAFATIQHKPHLTAIILAIQSATMIAGSLLAGVMAKHLSPLRAFTNNYAFWMIASLPLAFTNLNWTLMTLAGILGFFVGIQQVFYLEIIEGVRPKGSAASALGWLWMIEGTAAAIGASIGGIISQDISPRICFGLTTLSVIAGYVVILGGQKYLQGANRAQLPEI